MSPRLLLAVAVLGGCYRPSVAPCQLECFDNACPEALVCNTANQCVAALSDSCPNDGDAGIDAPPAIDAPPPPCVFHASNVDPCTLAPAGGSPAYQVTADWTIGAGAAIDTDGAQVTGLPAGAFVLLTSQLTGADPKVLVVAVHDFTLGAGTLNVTGSRPLIILASGTATIDASGTILVEPGNAVSCSGAGAGIDGAATSGGGGGGGAFSTNGGAGGAPMGGTAGGLANGIDTLRPLRGGCHGGAGAFAPSGIGTRSMGGAGGGAIQISAAAMLVVAGSISSPGGGGGAGGAALGGGGGGAGGAILLEAPTVSWAGSAKLCANGGGGGGAGAAGAGGQLGTCSPIAAAGGQGIPVGGAGAAGSGSGGVGPSTSVVGGGGGGGLGRIRIDATAVAGTEGFASPAVTTGLAP